MKRKILFILLIFLLFYGCLNKKKEALELVKQSKMMALKADDTWAGVLAEKILGDWTVEDFTSKIAEEAGVKGIKYEWKVKGTEENDFYIVSFVKKDEDWGYHWEADLNNKIVRGINTNKFLCLKYGHSRIKDDGSFTVEEVILEKMQYKHVKDKVWDDKNWRYKDVWYNKGIIYIYKGTIKNNIDKNITKADIKGTMFVIFKVDKIVEAESAYFSGFKKKVSTKNVWRPGETRTFYIETEPIDKIYEEYEPTDVFCEIDIKVEDPVGYEYEGVIKKIDIEWEIEK